MNDTESVPSRVISSTETDPTVGERGNESHPSWVVARASRVHSTPAQRLFDSEINHSEYVCIEIQGCTRNRDLGHDWIHGSGKTLVEVNMSFAQWGAFTSSFGDGSGVPVTLARFDGVDVPGATYESRLRESVQEVHDSAEIALAKVTEAADRVLELFAEKAGRREMGEALKDLARHVEQAPGSMEYAANVLVKHTEKVVTGAQGDIEAMVLRAAVSRGLDPGDIVVPALASGDVVDQSPIDAEIIEDDNGWDDGVS